MKKYLIVIFIVSHFMGSSLYAAKAFLEVEHIHSYTDRCFTHQHKHSHSKTNINYVDYFSDIQSFKLFDFLNSRC